MPPKTRNGKQAAQEPVDLRTKYGASFTILSDDEGERYLALQPRHIVKPCDFTMPFIENQVKLHNSPHYRAVLKYIDLLGCSTFATINPKGHLDLMVEFHTTFAAYEDYSGFTCRLGGLKVEVGHELFDEVFGLDFEGIPITADMEDYNDDRMWNTLTGKDRNGEKRIRSAAFTDEALLVAFKFLACVVFSREDSTKINSTERRILWCLTEGKTPCLIPPLLRAIEATYTTKGGLVGFGPFVSALASHVGIDLRNYKEILPRYVKTVQRTKGAKTTNGALLAPGEGTSGSHPTSPPRASTFPSTTLPAEDECGPLQGWSKFFKNQQFMCNLIGSLKSSVDERFDGLERRIDERFDGLERRIDKSNLELVELRTELFDYKKKDREEHRKTRKLFRKRNRSPEIHEYGMTMEPEPVTLFPDMPMDLDDPREDVNVNVEPTLHMVAVYDEGARDETQGDGDIDDGGDGHQEDMLGDFEKNEGFGNEEVTIGETNEDDEELVDYGDDEEVPIGGGYEDDEELVDDGEEEDDDQNWRRRRP